MVLISPNLWEKAMEQIRSGIGDEAFNAWMRQTALEEYDAEEKRLTLVVPNEFYRRWIEKRYLSSIEAAFRAELGEGLVVELVTDDETQEQEKPKADDRDDLIVSRRREQYLSAPEKSAPSHVSVRPIHVTPGSYSKPSIMPRGLPADDRDACPAPKLNPRYVFEEFVVGESNRYAHAAAWAVAEPQGKAFNPLFIYGGSGLGKTHLMQAIGHRMYAADNRLRVMYVTSEQFLNHYIESIQNKKPTEFRAAYRNVDLLLIDDVQFLMGRERTQHEFFHTFNTLYDAGKKVVVTSDRPPKDLSTLEERLRSRFEWGLLVDIMPPDLETRVAILRKKAIQEGIRLPDDVIFFIAERSINNIREMEGALKRLRMASSLHDRPIDLETARDVLGHLMVGCPTPRVTVEDVQRAVCQYFNIRVSDLLGKNRSKKFSQPRHLAQYLCRKLTDFSFPDIAQKFGGKDHTSIIYACRKVETAIQKDSNMANIIAHLTKQVTKGGE